ncbi:MAG: bifunctional biotin--[acetyl-CoA-carboxylase] ligase/biotin operon repressor BirA [Methylococcales bacterium]|nr:bifunctional biotin--[acetyl-CoA-carboxylase] ligase/biotin operon repressor BirA [Methylococcales bacterium]
MHLTDKQKKILTLLADGEFHSGTVLAEIVGISRAAVCNHINQLSETLDLSIAAVSGKGYRLEQSVELWAQEKIHAELNERSKTLISQLEIHDCIESTNRYLVEKTRHSAASGLVCFAEQQTAGKGRRGREWVSPFGSNIYVSIAWQFPQGGYAAIAGLSLAIGIAIIRALREQNIADVGLKWPNDIMSQGRKLGGILIEVSGEVTGGCSAVIGIGLNLCLPENKAQNITQAWTDITTITGQRPLRNALAGSLLNHLLPVIADFEERGLSAYLDEWRRYDCLKGQAALLFVGQKTIAGIVEGVNDDGLLLLKRADGTVQIFASGEVSFSGASA